MPLRVSSPRRRVVGARTLRRLLVAIAVVFVGCPLVVYHFFTFDFQRVPTTSAISRRFVGRFSPLAQLAGYTSGSTNSNSNNSAVDGLAPAFVGNYSAENSNGTALPRCLSLPTADFLSSEGVEAISRECGGSNSTASPDNSTSRDEKPSVLVHFAHVTLSDIPRLPGDPPPSHDPDERFTYVNFAALQSVQRALKPKLLFLHYMSRPRGEWFTQCQRYLSLHNVMPPIAFAPPASTDVAPLSLEKRRQIVQLLLVLRALRKQGGVGFVDFNTIMLRPLLVARENSELLVASQSASPLAFGVGLHMLQAPADHPVLEYLENKILEMAAQADSILYSQSLEQVVGQLVREQYATGEGARDVAVSTSALFEPTAESVGLLLSTRADSAHARSLSVLRDSVAFNVAPGNLQNAQDREALAQLYTSHSSAADWLSLDSVFGAVLRVVVGANTTDELGL